MTPLGPEVVGELVTEAIEARVISHGDRVVEILQRVLVEGTKDDALVFVMLCLFTISSGLSPRRETRLGPVTIDRDGVVSLSEAGADVGTLLMAGMLHDYLGGAVMAARSRWLTASDEAASGSVGAAIWGAATLIRQRRAVLN